MEVVRARRNGRNAAWYRTLIVFVMHSDHNPAGIALSMGMYLPTIYLFHQEFVGLFCNFPFLRGSFCKTGVVLFIVLIYPDIIFDIRVEETKQK